MKRARLAGLLFSLIVGPLWAYEGGQGLKAHAHSSAQDGGATLNPTTIGIGANDNLNLNSGGSAFALSGSSITAQSGSGINALAGSTTSLAGLTQISGTHQLTANSTTTIAIGATIQGSTTGWTTANSSVSTFTWTGWVLPIGGADEEVISSTYVAVSTGVCYQNLPSSVAYELQGLGLSQSITAPQSNRWIISLSTNVVGDQTADMQQAGWGLPTGGLVGDWGMGSGSNTYQKNCVLQQSGNQMTGGSDHTTIFVGHRIPIYPNNNFPGQAMFDYMTATTAVGVGLFREEGVCWYNAGQTGPNTSPVTSICLYAPNGATMNGTVRLLRRSQTTGGN